MKNDGFCIENDEFCAKNDEFCAKNDEFCAKNSGLPKPTPIFMWIPYYQAAGWSDWKELGKR